MNERRRLLGAAGGNIHIDPVFANNTWPQIALACKTGACRTLWSVGDTKTITCTDGRSYTIRIADMVPERYEYTDGSGYTNAVFEFVELFNNDETSTWKMHYTALNIAGWAYADLKTIIQGFVNILPSELSSTLKEVNILSVDKNASTSVSLSANKLFLPARYEMSTGTLEPYLYEVPKGIWQYYSVHSKSADRKKSHVDTGSTARYWTRSFSGANVYTVGTDGTLNSFGCTNSYGVALCFAL